MEDAELLRVIDDHARGGRIVGNPIHLARELARIARRFQRDRDAATADGMGQSAVAQAIRAQEVE